MPWPHFSCQGGGLRDSFLVDGVAFKKTFSYAGFEMQPKKYEVRSRCARGGEEGAELGAWRVVRVQMDTPQTEAVCPATRAPTVCWLARSAAHRAALLSDVQGPKILLLNIELELKSEKENAEVRLDDPSQYQSIVDAGEACSHGRLCL